jgi:tRNA (guanine37-N1)-methyltransferase
MRAGIPQLRSFDIIGHIAIINCEPDEPELCKQAAEEILGRFKHVRTVVKLESETWGNYRLRSYKLLAGESFFETLHKENGCIFKLDIRKVYFNPRLAGERQRIVSQIPEGSTVLDMFAGVGPFAIQIARFRNPEIVVANDLNPDAYWYLKENIRLNKVADKVIALNRDAAELVYEFKGFFDAIIMNLPTASLQFLDRALEMLVPRGIIHLYTFVERLTAAKLPEMIRRSAKNFSQKIKILEIRELKSVSSAKLEFAVKLQKLK